MKKTIILLLIFIFIFEKFLAGQISNEKELNGRWVSDGTSVKMNFFYNKKNKLRLTVLDTITGETTKIRSLKFVEDTVKTTEKFRSTKWLTHNLYYLISPDTLINIIKGDANTTLYFRRE